MSSYAQVVSAPAVSATLPAELTITKYSSVDETCAVLHKIGLMDCIPIIRKHNVDGDQLLEAGQKGFVAMLTSERMFDFQGRAKWRVLLPHLHFE